MVTTRSADKREKSPLSEDLVLRSRRIENPLSLSATPSKAGRRMTGAEDSPNRRNKRLRTIETDMKETPKALKPSVDQGLVFTPTADIGGNEVFRTPATSKHKRFDSDTSETDRQLATDSSAHNDFHTADEGSEEDNDEAPEQLSVRASSSKTSRRSGRPSKAEPKAKAKATAPSEIATEPAQPQIAEERNGEPKLEVHVVSQPSDPSTSLNQQPPPSILENAPPAQTIATSLDLDLFKPSSSAIPKPPLDLQSSTLSNRSVLDSPDIRPILPAKRSLDTSPQPSYSSTKLPSRSTKILESFRHAHVQRHRPLENTWSKKRSAFAVS